MNKAQFLLALAEKLSPLPQRETDDRLRYYSEMIDDRMEDGLTEEAAVAEMGSVEDIAAQIVLDIPLSKLVREKIKPKKRLSAWGIVLLVLGSPIWFSLLIAVFAVLVSLYVVLWSVILSFWATFISLAACTLGGIAVSIAFAFSGNKLTGIAMAGTTVICAGLSIFVFFGCKAASRGLLHLTKKLVLSVKRRFVGKERTA